jgi:MFS family permease
MSATNVVADAGTGAPDVQVDLQTDLPASYREVFAVAPFRALFRADLLSLLGDQVAVVALTVLLYQRSGGSPLVAALGYASSFVPWVIGGPLLAAWAERRPARAVMVGCDLARAGMIGLAALPGMPLPVLGILVFAAAMLAPPFESARSATQVRILPGDTYAVAISLQGATHYGAQVLGFLGGGSLVLLLSARGALGLDALTFLLSAAILRSGLAHLPAGQPDDEPVERPHDQPIDPAHATDGDPAPKRTRPSVWREAIEGWAVVRSDRRLIGPLLLSIAGAAYGIVPDAVATAYAASLGHGASGVGVLLAATAAGSIVAGLVLGRLARPSTRERLMYPLALAGSLPLMLFALRPGFWTSAALVLLTGMSGSFIVVANTVFAQAVPAAARARAFGIAGAGLYAGQAAAILLAGAFAQLFSARLVITGGGLAGAVAVLVLLVALRPRADRSVVIDLREVPASR